jgi:hypothetical protein
MVAYIGVPGGKLIAIILVRYGGLRVVITAVRYECVQMPFNRPFYVRPHSHSKTMNVGFYLGIVPTSYISVWRRL